MLQISVLAGARRPIALACGFADQSHMTRAFTTAIGVPPGAWRRQKRS
jgi:AraC-like DNA-binding protein